VKLTCGSFCSGIASAEVAWYPLGIEPLWFSEIDAFASALLAARFSGIPNMGDITKVNPDELQRPDVICAGTPCQSFSIAGLRGGLDDARGNLAIIFLDLVNKIRPRFFVWENVPGFLSIDGGDSARAFLDQIEAMGYVVDIDILDAQLFDVPQRRRRIFICAQSSKDILRQRTISSGLTIAQCVAETLLLALAVLKNLSPTDWAENLAFDAGSPSHSLRRRIRLFSLDAEKQSEKLLENLAALQPSFQAVLNDSESSRGWNLLELTRNTENIELSANVAKEFQNTELLLGKLLEETCCALRGFITSMGKSGITDREIFIFSQTLLHIAKLITQSLDCSPCFWSAAYSVLIAMKGFTNYARSATSSLFGDLEWIQPWCDFIKQAEPTIYALENLSVESFGKILPLKDCLRGDSPPSREAGQGIAAGLTRGADGNGRYAGRRREDDENLITAPLTRNPYADNESRESLLLVPTLPARTTAGGGMGTDFDCDGGLVIAHALTASKTATGRLDPSEQTLVVTHSLRSNGHDAGEDGTGRSTPIIPIQEIGKRQSGTPKNGVGYGASGDPMFTLQSGAQHAIAFTDLRGRGEGLRVNGDIAEGLHCAKGISEQQAIAFQSRIGRNGRGQPKEICDALTSCEGGTHADSKPHCVDSQMRVRRLTPMECERLQGLPDGWTAIQYRGKAAADGPRYRAIGNAMAVPVMRWIGERILAVEAMTNART
jgi:DNA-cytosine methyltransferase